MFYLTTHSTHFLRLYGVGDMVKDHSHCEGGKPLPPHGLLFPISSKGSFICIIPSDHGICYTSRGALAGKEKTVSCTEMNVGTDIICHFSLPETQGHRA